jgi:hypothetical protein
VVPMGKCSFDVGAYCCLLVIHSIPFKVAIPLGNVGKKQLDLEKADATLDEDRERIFELFKSNFPKQEIQDVN